MTPVVIAFVLGLVFGSFLNVCISRLPRHESIARPRSRCPHCAAPITWYDNIPLFGYLLLRAHCRSCCSIISARYPLVELSVALAWSACIFVFGPTPQAARIAVFCWLLIGLLLTDVETYTLPDALTLPGIAVGFAFAIALAPEGHRLAAFLHTALAAFGFAALFLLIRALYWIIRRTEGMGLGDVKLISLIATYLLITNTTITLTVAVFAASLFSIALIVRGKRKVQYTRLPFGAFLAAGGLVSAFAGSRILNWYLVFFH